MTQPTQAQPTPTPQYPNPPVKMNARWLKTTAIVVGGAIVALVAIRAAVQQTIDEGNEAGLKILEDKVKFEKADVPKYEHVREFIRAKREKRAPRLTPDESDEAREIAEKFAKTHDLEAVLRD